MYKKYKPFFRESLRLWRKSVFVFREQGMSVLLERAKFEISRRIFFARDSRIRRITATPVRQLLRKKFINTRPIDFLKVKRETFRFNLVTDSLEKESLFGGVATALILATLFSKKYNVPLRIITRTTKANPKSYDDFLKLMRIQKPAEVEFFSDYDSFYTKNAYKLEVSEKDVFLATSWWTAESIEQTNLRNKFFYILQEVETFFYPNGDEQYMCENILKSCNINFIVNSKLLYDYYLKNKIEQVINSGIYFEPAFPEHIYAPGEDSFRQKNKYRMFFYSRPKNPRNLFFTGLKIIDEACLRGIIKKDEWEICFAGSNLDPIEFSNGARPVLLGQMNWEEYGAFLKTLDLGFSLMFTPHPSYPPLDMAASGGVVLTNKFANKKSLDNYSKNIICEDLDIKPMMEGFIKAVNLVKNNEARKNNYAENRIERRWEDTFNQVLDFINEKK